MMHSNGEPHPSDDMELDLLGDERLQPWANSPQLTNVITSVVEAARLNPADPGDADYIEQHVEIIAQLYGDLLIPDSTVRALIAETRQRLWGDSSE